VASGKCIADLNSANLRQEKYRSQGIAFSPDGKTVASADSDGVARLWDVATGKNPMTMIPGQRIGGLTCVAFRADGRTLISAGYVRGEIMFWDVANGTNTADFRAHLLRVRSVAVSKDGKMLASASGEKTIELWEMPAKK
jgi:WD40 repeat protein